MVQCEHKPQMNVASSRKPSLVLTTNKYFPDSTQGHVDEWKALQTGGLVPVDVF